MIVPLRARGRILGVLTLVISESSRPYGEDDLLLAVEMGSRAALAVDNARLWEETRKAVQERELALKLHCDIEEQLTLLVEASGSLSASLDRGSDRTPSWCFHAGWWQPMPTPSGDTKLSPATGESHWLPAYPNNTNNPRSMSRNTFPDCSKSRSSPMT